MSILIGASVGLVLFSYKAIISPLLETISSTKDIVTKLIKVNHSNISQNLKELAIISRIETINSFIREIECEEKPTSFIKTFEGLIKDINDTLFTIRIALQDIETKVSYHNTIYFQNWRNLDCDKEFNIVVKYNEILKEQFDMLIKILAIPCSR
jgi:hypothetical protein